MFELCANKLTEPIHERFGVYSEEDYDSLSAEDQREFEEIMESLDESFGSLHKSFGFSEPELTESQQMEFESKLAGLDRQYEAIHAKYVHDLYFTEECMTCQDAESEYAYYDPEDKLDYYDTESDFGYVTEDDYHGNSDPS